MKKLLFLLVTLLLVGGCSSFTIDKLSTEGAKASGFCVRGGPGGVAGLGPSGVVVGGKVNSDFVGIVVVTKDCDVTIQSYPSPTASGLGLILQ
jgi:hypothetical protein